MLQFFTSPLGQALFFGVLALWITLCFSKPMGLEFQLKDYGFIITTMLVVYIHRIRKRNFVEKVGFETKGLKAAAIRNVNPAFDNTTTDEIQIESGMVTLILFFETYAKPSRVGIQYLNDKIIPLYPKDQVKWIGLTQESSAELLKYEEIGLEKASYFSSLKKSAFQIGIEDGEMFKQYQLRHNITTMPHLYLIGKDLSYIWHGHPLDNDLQSNIAKALEAHRSKKDTAPKC